MLTKVSKSFFSSPAFYASFLAKVQIAPPDPILGLGEAFKKDTFAEKVNVGIGAYRDNNGKPVVLNCVRKAQERIVARNPDNEYLPGQGLQKFLDCSLDLAYGKDYAKFHGKKIAAIQGLSGTGCLRLALDFIKRHKPGTDVYVPNPTWGNHNTIIKDAGLVGKVYSYYDAKTISIDFKALIRDLENAKDESCILFHPCSHNPTGVDPTQDQWRKIRDVCEKKRHIAFFDMPYQGFATGDVVNDAFAVRHFAERSHKFPVFCAHSFSKNIGLYGQRVGALHIHCSTVTEATNVLSQLKVVARGNYSNPPAHGARIVAEVMGDEELYAEWLVEVKAMADRIKEMRSLFVKCLKSAGSKKNWDHINKQIGMFAFTGVNTKQAETLVQKHHIYMTKNGRISIAGLTTKNCPYVAKCFHEVTK